MNISKYITEEILIEIINRSEMPQIKGDNIEEALATFDKYGVPYKQEKLKVDALMPIQHNAKLDKIEKISAEIKKGNAMNPIFISNDNYIVDGHHRWLAYKNLNKDIIECIIIGYPKMAALSLFNKVADKFEQFGEAFLKEQDLNEKYLQSNKIFTAINDLSDYGVKKGDKVKIDGLELNNGYFGVVNIKNGNDFRIYSLEFIKNFK